MYINYLHRLTWLQFTFCCIVGTGLDFYCCVRVDAYLLVFKFLMNRRLHIKIETLQISGIFPSKIYIFNTKISVIPGIYSTAHTS